MIRVLIPTDFSDNAFNAISYARMLFQEKEAVFTLLHAYEPTALQLVGGKSPTRLSSIYNSLKVNAQNNLTRLQEDIDARTEIDLHSYKTMTIEGHLKEILNEIAAKDYDYIVMGSKGATGLKEVFIGSTTYAVVATHPKIPLLIIPNKCFFKAPENIGFATDFKRDYHKEELQPLVALTSLWNSTVRMIEVYKKSTLSIAQKSHLQQLESLLQDIDYRFHVIPKFSSLENCINVFDQELAIDMLVMIDYPKPFFERIMREPIIKKMSFHTTLPFLILPAIN